MSLFLGKIHYWLYNKILLSERIEEEIVNWAKEQGLPADEWMCQSVERYGKATGGKPLEEIIDTSNIHGWLQERITSAELRQAALVTAILKEKPEYKAQLAEIFKEQGERAARQISVAPDTPEELFNVLNDHILEGMPCDRVSEFISGDDDEFVWQLTACLHKVYWDEVQGNIQNFYDLREAWVKAFIETLNPGFAYEKLSGGMHRIKRRQESR